AYGQLTEDLVEISEQFENQTERLRLIRSKPLESMASLLFWPLNLSINAATKLILSHLAAGIDIVDETLDNIDVLSDSTSMASSTFTRYTATNAQSSSQTSRTTSVERLWFTIPSPLSYSGFCSP